MTVLTTLLWLRLPPFYQMSSIWRSRNIYTTLKKTHRIQDLFLNPKSTKFCRRSGVCECVFGRTMLPVTHEEADQCSMAAPGGPVAHRITDLSHEQMPLKKKKTQTPDTTKNNTFFSLFFTLYGTIISKSFWKEKKEQELTSWIKDEWIKTRIKNEWKWFYLTENDVFFPSININKYDLFK